MKFLNNKCFLDLHNKVALEGVRVNNIYMMDLDNLNSSLDLCLKITLDEYRLWHKRLYQASMYTLRKITCTHLVRDVPKIDYFDDHLCDACMHGKKH